MNRLRHMLIFSMLCFALTSCEVIARFFLFPAECYVCEIRAAKDLWSEKPLWQDDACGAGVVRLRDACEFKSRLMEAECVCMQYVRN